MVALLYTTSCHPPPCVPTPTTPHSLTQLCQWGSAICLATDSLLAHRHVACQACGMTYIGPAAQVSLVVPWKARPAVGTEVLINYGRKSNEELLLLYGELPFHHTDSTGSHISTGWLTG